MMVGGAITRRWPELALRPRTPPASVPRCACATQPEEKMRRPGRACSSGPAPSRLCLVGREADLGHTTATAGINHRHELLHRGRCRAGNGDGRLGGIAGCDLPGQVLERDGPVVHAHAPVLLEGYKYLG